MLDIGARFCSAFSPACLCEAAVSPAGLARAGGVLTFVDRDDRAFMLVDWID